MTELAPGTQAALDQIAARAREVFADADVDLADRNTLLTAIVALKAVNAAWTLSGEIGGAFALAALMQFFAEQVEAIA